MPYRIRCEVSGGVTGHRVSVLKENGKVAEFRHREEAEKVARRLNIDANTVATRAVFSYTVIEGPKHATL